MKYSQLTASFERKLKLWFTSLRSNVNKSYLVTQQHDICDKKNNVCISVQSRSQSLARSLSTQLLRNIGSRNVNEKCCPAPQKHTKGS